MVSSERIIPSLDGDYRNVVKGVDSLDFACTWKPESFLGNLTVGEAKVVLAASISQDSEYPIPFTKKSVREKGVLVRLDFEHQ